MLTALLLLGGCAWLRSWWPGATAPAQPAFSGPPPVVFLHGNGDNGATWTTTVWRFESQGWPRDRLFVLDQPLPLARDDDGRPQEGRSSTDDARRFLAGEIERVRRLTGAPRVAVVANSRGGLTLRNLLDAGPAATAGAVSHAVLGGTPNHGVWSDPAERPGSEFNGAGPFLTRLNRPRNAAGDEVTPGTQWLTIRSDANDKFAQPTGEWIGRPGRPTGVGADGPALKGATNRVIPGIDHRETSYGAQAFAETWRFLTGQAPPGTGIVPEAAVTLAGTVFGLGLANRPGGGNFSNNLPLAGATVEVWSVRPASGERIGQPLWRGTVGADGRWGPLTTTPDTPLEFVVAAPGFAVHHVYRAPFPRSSSTVHLGAARIADNDRDGAVIVQMSRPRGYFGVPRDEIGLDGRTPPPGIPPGVAGVSSTKLVLREPAGRAIVGEFNGERVIGRTWPAAENHLVTLELHR
ncbi:hypothetical protein ISF6_0091 [Piscinibacter sakaiensis]|uniref:AFL C-terminal domain-containing protein n=2 Tax=Piscinibacter sakaiensis TaxID=1547922 RepID=A0A0K8NUM5_PISS1|nr:hypothetical protein ISF6_0091 [Piscinibacter sakaiensis]